MTNIVPPVSLSAADPGDQRRRAFRPVVILISTFLGLSAATEAVIVGLSVSGSRVDGSIWTRCSIVLAGAIVLLLLTRAAAGGSRAAFLRLRIITVVVVAAALVIAAIPGFLPDLVRLEQLACAAVMLPVAILLNLPHFAARVPRSHA